MKTNTNNDVLTLTMGSGENERTVNMKNVFLERINTLENMHTATISHTDDKGVVRKTSVPIYSKQDQLQVIQMLDDILTYYREKYPKIWDKAESLRKISDEEIQEETMLRRNRLTVWSNNGKQGPPPTSDFEEIKDEDYVTFGLKAIHAMAHKEGGLLVSVSEQEQNPNRKNISAPFSEIELSEDEENEFESLLS